MEDSIRLKVCNFGATLLKIFLASVTAFAVVVLLAVFALHIKWTTLLVGIIICAIIEFIIFWIGIVCVYGTSVQLGIKIRVIGAVVGLIPIANIIALLTIIRTVSEEVLFNREKIGINKNRKQEQVCKTKYPIVMVHGVFFRDYKFLNYWGRIPKELESNGATIYFGNQQSAASVADSAKELAERINEIIDETGSQKVNVIAHSKGGLDIRYAMSHYGVGELIASVTTINTPHRVCHFAEYLLDKAPLKLQHEVEKTYNNAMKKLRDPSPDFMAAVTDLTASRCTEMDKELKAPDSVFCQSIGSKLNKATGGKFPLNFSYNLVKHFDGPNDGLVAEDSFSWGEKYTFLETYGKRGISHGDMIDLNRENIKGFDVREFYVQLVSELRHEGM